MITYTLSTFNTINYLKLAIHSTRENSYYKDAPFIIHAENCTDGTNEWLEENKDQELKEKFMKYINNRDTDELINSIKEDIKLMMYNKKEMIC